MFNGRCKAMNKKLNMQTKSIKDGNFLENSKKIRPVGLSKMLFFFG
jgi:hypothetical protein